MPYISDIDREYSDRSGIFGPNTSLYTQSMFYTTARMTHGFSGKPFGSPGFLGGYLTGMNNDISVMRKLAGITMPSRGYNWLTKHTGKFGASLASKFPTLGHLLPSRYLTLWSALSGNQKAMETLGFDAAINRTVKRSIRKHAKHGINITEEAVRKEFLGGRNGFLNFGKSMYDAPLRTRVASVFGDIGYGEKTFGDLTRKMAKGLSNRLAKAGGAGGAKYASQFLGMIGMGANPIAKWMVSKIPQSVALKAAGRYIMPLSRLGGWATLGIDAGHLAIGAGAIAGKAFIGGVELPMKMYRGITQEIHRGTFMSSSPMSPFVGATQRQRAMANIYEKQLNLRQVMGNEAPYLAAQWG